MFRKLAVIAFSGLLAALSFGQQNYASQSVNIRIAKLLLQSEPNSSLYAPNFLVNLCQDTLIKPASWSLINPNPGVNPVTGQSYTRKDSAYWQVNINTLSDAQVANYDVLVVEAQSLFNVDPVEVARLRRFMDAGGILWVDLNGGASTTDLFNGFPLAFQVGSGAPPLFAQYQQPILNYPNAITYTDLNIMSGPSPATAGIAPVLTSNLSVPELAQNVPGDSARLQNIYGSYGDELISLGAEGDGCEVVTCNDITDTIGNAGTTGSTDSVEAALKLAVNIIALHTQYGQAGGGAHKTGANSSDAQSALLQEWTDSTSAWATGYTPSTTYGYSPATSYKGYVVVSQPSTGTIYVYNGQPSTTENGQTSVNNLGKPYDLLYTIPVGTSPISSPTCIEVPSGSGASTVPVDEVWVVDGGGNLDGYFLSTGLSVGAPIAGPTTAGTADQSLDAPGPYPPTYSDGLLFVADAVPGSTPPSGRVWIADPASDKELQSSITGDDGWSAGGAGNGVLTEVSGPPTVGYVPDSDGSGEADRVVYVPSYPVITGTTTSGPTVTGLWLGARGELIPTSNASLSGGVLTITTRAAQRGAPIFIPGSGDAGNNPLLAMGPKLTAVDVNGNPMSESQMASVFGDQEPTESGTGLLQYTVSNPGALAGYSFRVDYSLDWGQQNPASYINALEHSQLALAACPSGATRILDHVVLAPNGLIYVVASSQDSSGTNSGDNSGGDYYELQDTGSTFNVVVRWSLYDEFTMGVNGGTQTVLPVVSNQDPLLQLPGVGAILSSSSPDYAGQMQNMTFTSGPVVSGSTVYCTAQGSTNKGIPDTILFAFNANPPVATIPVNSFDATQSPVLTQPDITRSSDRNAPNSISTLAVASLIPDLNSATGTYQVRIPNLNTTATQVVNCLSLSEPVVYSSGGSDLMIYPDTVPGGHWSPLQWYTVFTGSGQTTGAASVTSGEPYVSDGTVYVPLLNQWANLLINNTFGPVGMIYGINSTIASNDAFMIPDQHAWQNQLVSFDAPAGSAITANNLVLNGDFEWPHLTDLNTATGNRFSLLQQRLAQSTLKPTGGTSASQIYGLVGGNGRLFAWSNEGLFGYEKADYVVADNGRVGEFDAVGNPIWSSDQSLSTGAADTSQVGNVHTLVTPTRSYPLGNGENFVVDSGGNRISVMDRSGHELRSITGFTLDPVFVPDGYTPGETTKFSAPNDLAGSTSVVTTGNPFTSPPPAAAEYWVNYVVADSGNKRLVDLVDRYNYDLTTSMVGSPIALGQLYWHTPASVSGGSYSYSCVALPNYINGANTVAYIAAGIGNTQPSSSAGGGTNSQGGIVVFPNGTAQPTSGAPQPYIITNFNLPAVPGGFLYSEGGAGDLSGTFTASSVGVPNMPITSVNSLTSSYDPTNGSKLMFTDSAGVFEMAALTPTTNNFALDWMLPRSLPVSKGITAPVYSVMRTAAGSPTTGNPLDFRPTYAQRLMSGDVVVVNGYSGRYRKANPGDSDVQFQGEVLEIDPTVYNSAATNLGYTTSAILYELPPVTGARGIAIPVFATRR